LCEYSESVIIVRLTADPMTFLRAIPCPAVSPRRSFLAKMGALTKVDAPCVSRIFAEICLKARNRKHIEGLLDNALSNWPF